MPDAPIIDLVLRLWPAARDEAVVADPADLDLLLATQGGPGAPGRECGLRHTFACFGPDREAALELPTGERSTSDAEARFVGHLLVTRLMLAAGLAIDERVTGAMSDAYGLSWTASAGGHYGQTPLALAVALWLVALDPLSLSDRPLPIEWGAACYEDATRWDPEYRLFSHYDMRERALDWASYVSAEPGRHPGVSIWTIVEPLLRMTDDSRSRLALGQLSEAGDVGGPSAAAAAMLERNRVAQLLRAEQRGGTGNGTRPVSGTPRR